jgi:hypothetical protein
VIGNQTGLDPCLLKKTNIHSVSDDDLEKDISIGVTDKSDSLSQFEISDQQIPSDPLKENDIHNENEITDKSDSLSQFDILNDQQTPPTKLEGNDIHNENETPPSNEVK